jgi:signal transduction histidine kinase
MVRDKFLVLGGVCAAELGLPLALEPTHQLGLFRVAQQALTNALRHAGATCVRITLCWDEATVELSVSDDGTGFDTELPRKPEQQGLHGMRERMELLGGLFSVTSLPGCGTTVRVSVQGRQPLQPAP